MHKVSILLLQLYPFMGSAHLAPAAFPCVLQLVEIKNLAVYWDTDATFMSYESTAELSKKLNDLVRVLAFSVHTLCTAPLTNLPHAHYLQILSYEDSKKTAKAPHYIVRPVSSELKVP